MNANEVLAHINERLGTSYKIVGPYSEGESGDASKVVDEHSNRYVLKLGARSEFRADSAARTTHRLRGLGYPAPEYVAIGKVGDVSYALQSAMPGAPIRQRVSLALLPQLLRLNNLQRGQGDVRNDEPEHIIRGVMEAYSGFLHHRYDAHLLSGKRRDA